MKYIVTFVVAFFLYAVSFAAQSWAGSNLYYAAGLTAAEQKTLFTQLQAADVKVLRVWLDGESSGQKGTTFPTYPSLEPSTIGTYDDTVLNLLDDVMATAASYGIKVLISLYSYNSLSAGDVYGNTYGTEGFYTNSNAISSFENRLWHALYHVNPNNGKTWADSSEYIFAFEAQNEAMSVDSTGAFAAAHASWQCTMAESLKSAMGESTAILVTTGGGQWVDESLQSAYFSCAALDVLAIHAYGTGDFTTSKLSPYVTKAVSAGKKLLMEEWGACYWNTANNVCGTGTPLSMSTRDSNIENWADLFGSVGIPWMYWQIIPNNDPHGSWDYEVGITEASWATLKSVAQGASGYSSPFDYSDWLL